MHQIVVSNSAENVLSKQQQLFNKLIKSIENCKKDIEKESVKLDKTLADYRKNVLPLKQKLLEKNYLFIKKMDEMPTKVKLTRKQMDALRSIILYHFNELFHYQMANAEQEELYNKWSEVSYKEELEAVTAERKKDLQAEMKAMTGVDVDMSEYGDSEEDAARFFADFKRKMAEKKDEQETRRQQANKQRKKTKAQIKREDEEALFEEMKSKNLRSIYVGLAKLLHPDTEINESLKAEKEEVMKKVTAAYEQKDIAALLTLEIEWVHKNNNMLHQLKDDVLKVYCKVLKEQIDELRREKYSLSNHPKYEPIQNKNLFGFGVINIKQEERKILNETSLYKNNIQIVEACLLGQLKAETVINKIAIAIEEEVDFSDALSMLLNMR